MNYTSATIQRALDPKDQQEQETAYSKWVYWEALYQCNHTLQFNGSNTHVINKEPYALELHANNLEDMIQKIHKEFADYKANISEKYPLLWIVPPDTLRCEFIAKNKNFMLHIENHVKYATYRDKDCPTMIVELPKSWIEFMRTQGNKLYINGFYTARVYPTECLYALEYKTQDKTRDYTTYNWSRDPFNKAKRDAKGKLCAQWMDKEKRFLAVTCLSRDNKPNPAKYHMHLLYDWDFYLANVPIPEKQNETIAPIVEVLMPEPKLK